MSQITLEQCVESGIDQPLAESLLPRVNEALHSLSATECWRLLSREILTPQHPFSFHTFLFEATFSDWDDQNGPPPAWIPNQIGKTNIARLMKDLQLRTYDELHRWSVDNRSEFWGRMIKILGIRFNRDYTKVVDLSKGVESPSWLVDAKLNIAESCFQAPAEAIAIVSKKEKGPLTRLSYRELSALVNRVANGLTDEGIKPGDPIAIDMPMTLESVAIYLGIVKAGCVAVSIADSFAANEIATRLRLSSAKAIFTQDHILRSGKRLPLYERIVSAKAPMAIVLSSEGENKKPSVDLREGDVDWGTFLSNHDSFESASRSPSDPTNILFSSGTTGEPKAIPWSQTTPIKSAVDGHLHQDIQPGDVVAWPTNLGWMMGPWLIYASLLNQATIALYDGAPTGREFGRFVQDAKVTILGVVPSLVRTWRDTDCMNGLDWQTIKAFSSTGEASNAQDMLFLMSLAGYQPVIEYCGGTEIGGGHITGTMVQSASPATFTTPALGMDFVLLDENGAETDDGEIFLIPPSIGLSAELLNRDHYEVYFEGTPASPTGSQIPLRRHGDQVVRLGKGYFRAQGRVDDTMNLGGIKVSANEIEQTLSAAQGISETAAIAVSPHEGGPSRLVVYAVLSDSEISKDVLLPSLQNAIRQNLNPLFRIHDLVVVDSLPRTASNKVMRRVLRDEYVKGA